MNKESIVGKLIIRGKLSLNSPLLIGSGMEDDSNQTDVQILKDKDGIPFIPGTSLTGVIRQYVELEDNRAAALLFGTSKDFDKAYSDELQSSVIIYDVKLSNADIVHRDSVNIDGITGTGIDAGKFDYEVIERGAHGIFATEINFRGIHETEEEILRRSLMRLGNYLSRGFYIGARTSIGFGKAVISDMEVIPYDFRTMEDTKAWFMGKPSQNHFVFSPSKNENVYPNDSLVIKANFALSSSLIVRDARKEILDMASDGKSNLSAVMLQDSDGNWILPGSSIKGVLRHRAEHILRTLEKENFERLEKLMGPDSVKLRQKNSEKYRSRFRVAEVKLSNDVHYYPQSRVRIDRFTGGNIDGSLFTEGPVWQNGQDAPTVSMEWEINGAKNWDIGLAILLLKDVWLGKVAFGGGKSIGRGTLRGVSAKIYWHNEEITLGADGKADEKAAKELQQFVDAFVEEKEAIS